MPTRANSISQRTSFCTCKACIKSLCQQKSDEYKPGESISLKELYSKFNIPPELLEKKVPGLLKIIVDFNKNETGRRITSKRRAQTRQVLCEQQSHLTHFDPDCVPERVVVFGVASPTLVAKMQNRIESHWQEHILQIGDELRTEWRSANLRARLSVEQVVQLKEVSAMQRVHDSGGHDTDLPHSVWLRYFIT